MNKLNIKVHGSKLLYPVYDINKHVVDILPFQEKHLLTYKNKKDHTHGLSTLFNNVKNSGKI